MNPNQTIGNASSASIQDISQSFTQENLNIDRTLNPPPQLLHSANASNIVRNQANTTGVSMNTSGFKPQPATRTNSRGKTSFDRFITRANNPIMKDNIVAEACGFKVNRVLDYTQKSNANSVTNQFASDLFSGPPPALKATTKKREIPTKPRSILDAPLIENNFYTNVIDWSAHNNSIAIALSNCIYAYNPDTKSVNVLDELQESSPTSLKWTASNDYIAVGSEDGKIALYDSSTQQHIRTMRTKHGRVGTLAWEDHTLTSGGKDGRILHHDVRIKKHKTASLVSHDREICGLSWRPDGRMLASGGNDNLVNLWDVRVTSTPRNSLQTHQAAVKALAWCPWHTNVLATGGGMQDGMVHFWNTTTGTRLKSHTAAAQITALHWNPNHKEIVVSMGHPHNSIQVFSYPTLEQIASIPAAHDDRILGSAVNSTHSVMATCAADEKIKLWILDENPAKKRTLPPLALSRI